VSRVYLTQKIDIVIRDARSGSAGLSAGARKPVELMSLESTDDPQKASIEAYDDNLKKLNTSLATLGPKVGETLLPGGTVKVAAASHST